MAAAIKTRPLFLAWGSGRTWWDSTITQSRIFATDAIATDYPHLDYLAVTNADGSIVYTVGVDYSVNSETGIITRLSGGSIPPGGTVVITYTPHREAEDTEATQLIEPIGFRPVTEVGFVFEDAANGTIQLTSGRYSPSVAPTPELYTRTSYDYEDGMNSTIRELALYMDTAVKPGLPAGQQYFAPSEIASTGILLALQHLPPLRRDNAVKQTFEFVLVV